MMMMQRLVVLLLLLLPMQLLLMPVLLLLFSERLMLQVSSLRHGRTILGTMEELQATEMSRLCKSFI